MQGFLLGLANGATCLAYCAPVLVPLFLGEGKKTSQNWGLMAKFLIGRLVGYLLFGLLAWITGRLILTHLTYKSLVMGAVYITLAGLMLFYGLSGPARVEHRARVDLLDEPEGSHRSSRRGRR